MTETPKSFSNAFSALVAAQEIMEPLYKGAINPAFKGEGKPKGTSYADFADVCATVREPFAQCQLAHYSHMIRHEAGMDWRTVVVHGPSGTEIHCDVPLIVDRNNMQGFKSAVTYAKRIGLESLAGLAPEDDDGNAAASAPPAKQGATKQEPAAMPDAQWAKLVQLVEATDSDTNAMCKHYGIRNLRELSADGYGKAVEALEKKLAKMAKEETAQKANGFGDVLGDEIPEFGGAA